MPVESLQQLLDWQVTQQPYIIDQGILLPETRLIIFGSPKAWKSMTSIHTGFHIATGTDWFGHKVTKSAVLLHQTELPKAVFKRRVEKYSANFPIKPDNLFLETAPYSKIDTSYGLSALEKSIVEVLHRAPNQHLVLILDPAYKLMAGNIAEEQDTKRFTDNIDTLRTRYYITVIIVHHSRKIHLDASGKIVDLGSEDMYGGELQKWCDTAVQCKLLNPYTGSNKVKVSFDLTRNAETIISNLEVDWSRATLQPTITRVITPEPDEPPMTSIRDLG